MTTDAEAANDIVRSTRPLADPEGALGAAATVLREKFGLGEQSEASTAWPVDDGDRVFLVEVTGAIAATLLLAVNDEVAGRLSNDTYGLAAGFRAAVDAMVATLAPPDGAGTDVDVSEAELVEAASVRPEITVEIQDNKRLSAIVGLIPRAVAADVDLGQPGLAGWNDSSAGPVDSMGRPLDGSDSFVPQSFAAEQYGVSVGAGPLSLLHDVDMEVTVELGRTTMPIRELLALQPGMVVEIDRAASAPIDVLVNGRRIACGEVVVIDEEFGIRITEIVTSSDHRR